MKIVLPAGKLTRKLLLLIVLIVQGMAYSQVNFTDSNLPIVLITTDINPNTGQPTVIPDEPKVPASMKIIYHTDGSRNYVSDQNNPDYLDYDGRIKIEIRGSSSQDLPKKQYGWTTYEDDDQTKQNVKLLGMPKENDWILNGLAFDPSLIRDYLSYNLARQIGDYAVRTQYCEVMINGDYKGLYILQEKIKDDSNRVNIEGIEPEDNTQPALSGGYITKADKQTGGDPIAWSMESYAGWTDFIHELPKPEEVTPQQDSYIHQQFTDLASTAHANNAGLVSGYPSIIDIPTFVDFMVLNELASNSDAYQLSTFFHKDLGGKLRAGPIWDFNLTYGNDLFMYGLDRSHTDVWQFSNGDNEGPKFWTDLFIDTDFRCYFSRRWHELTQPGQPLNYNSISDYIDEVVDYISEASVREQARWNTVPDQAGEIAALKTWLNQRIVWITSNIGSYSACSNVAVPPLMITKINYHPDESPEFPESDDQEFIAIQNTGTATVNLTGIYFRELGISYEFPVNSEIAGGETIYLASNPEVFQQRYGLTAFGKYFRNLSNSSQNLVLADGFGNIIDAVEYDDDDPWPDADGSGNYLQLISTDMDNSQASSWEAVSEDNLSTAVPESEAAIAVYPNPVHNTLTIVAPSGINTIALYDIYGKLLKIAKADSSRMVMDMSGYASGVYFIKISGDSGTITQKIIRQ